MVTIYDVAKRAEVSAATVSRVLNGHVSVAPHLADRVREAVAELGYRPNALARNLRRSRTSLWAVMIPDVGAPDWAPLVRAVEDEARSAGYSLVVCSCDRDPEREADYVSVALAEQMAGVVIAPVVARSVERLLAAHTPLVVIGRELPETAADTVRVTGKPELGAAGPRIGQAAGRLLAERIADPGRPPSTVVLEPDSVEPFTPHRG
ncbi:MAG: LacI family DNA-binding transcriptional regulator [Micromonosporaceae bacterium]